VTGIFAPSAGSRPRANRILSLGDHSRRLAIRSPRLAIHSRRLAIRSPRLAIRSPHRAICSPLSDNRPPGNAISPWSVGSYMTNRDANKKERIDDAAVRESGVWEKGAASPEEEPRARLAAIFRAEEKPLFSWLLLRVPAQVAVEIRAETFLALVERTHAKGGVPPAARVELYRMARDRVRNHGRARLRQRLRDGGDEVDAVPCSQRDAEQAAMGAQDRRFLWDLLGALTAEDEALIRSAELDGATTAAIAAALGIGEEAARKRLSRALARLEALARRRARGR
jgi:DNA-directed RNA polymerase specialized sigma24 family protein